MKNIFLFLLSLTVFSCTTSNKNVGSSKIYKMWNVVSVEGADEALIKEAKTFINLSDKDKMGARAGCNHIFFTANSERENQLHFSGIGSTRMYCDKFMDLENQFLKQLEAVRSYHLSDENINFLDANGKVIITATTGISWDAK